jgi:hypothetical protein
VKYNTQIYFAMMLINHKLPVNEFNVFVLSAVIKDKCLNIY